MYKIKPMKMYLTCLVILVTLSSSMALTCPNITGNSGVLPYLDSKKFHYKIQITIPDLNETIDGYEFYDHVNKTTFLYVDKNNGNQSFRSKMAFDYQNNQTFILNELTNDCVVQAIDLSQDQLSLFGLGVENGPENITASFNWNTNYSSTFVNITTVDGIATEHFTTCLSFNNGSLVYMVDVYFSSSHWKMPSGQKAPVMLTLKATVEEAENTTTSRLYIYKFSDYHTSESADTWRPQLPGGVICPGRKDAPKKPTVPEVFQLNFELLWKTKSFTEKLNELYDYQKKLFRLDQWSPVKSTSTIHDFKQGLQFNIDLDRGNCTTAPLVASFYFDVKAVNETHVTMEDPSAIVQSANITYGGVTNFNGARAHCWIGVNPQEIHRDYVFDGMSANIYTTYYYSVESYNGLQHPLIGMRVKYVSMVNKTEHNRTEFVLSVSNFKAEAAPITAYDISPCYGQDHKETYVLKFPGEHYESIAKNPIQFKHAMITASAKYANISEIRIAPSVNFIPVDELNAALMKNETRIYVWVTLLGVLDIQGTSVEMEPQLSLADATKSFESAITDNEFIVTFDDSNENVVMTAFADFVKTQKDLLVLPTTPTPAPTSPPASGISTGVVVGVAFAMLIAGIVLGCIVMICRGRRDRAQYAYTMQD